MISIKLLYSFFGATLRRGSSPTNLLFIFRAPLCGSTYRGILLSFENALLSLIVHFKDTFTYCYNCFVHDSHIFNILQLLLIICNSRDIWMSCIHNLKLYYFSKIEHDRNKLRFHHME